MSNSTDIHHANTLPPWHGYKRRHLSYTDPYVLRQLHFHAGKETWADSSRTSDLLRSMLPQDYEYVFAEADIECNAAEGVEGIFPAPYLCFHQTPTCDAMNEAEQAVWRIIDAEERFDGVIGFSQGASLAATVILHQAMGRTEQQAPFRFAVFLCCGLPYSSLLDVGKDVSQEWDSAVPVRRFSPEVDLAQIDIPTVHLLGRKDSYYAGGKLFTQLCDPLSCHTVEHPQGHIMPRSTTINQSLARAVERVIALAEMKTG